jgi:crotonobetainyl-CoA:carnitine CoA-transferase CaiB-like acyl-CoA transferase
LSESFWRKLCDALERPDLAQDPRLATATLRRDRRDEVDRVIAEVTRTRSVADWQERLTAFDVPHAPVLGVGAALAHPHARAREMVTEADHATAGRVRLVGRPIKFPGSTQPPSTAPPTLGQHTVEILCGELGCSEAEIAALRRDGAIDRLTKRHQGDHPAQ